MKAKKYTNSSVVGYVWWASPFFPKNVEISIRFSPKLHVQCKRVPWGAESVLKIKKRNSRERERIDAVIFFNLLKKRRIVKAKEWRLVNSCGNEEHSERARTELDAAKVVYQRRAEAGFRTDAPIQFNAWILWARMQKKNIIVADQSATA